MKNFLAIIKGYSSHDENLPLFIWLRRLWPEKFWDTRERMSGAEESPGRHLDSLQRPPRGESTESSTALPHGDRFSMKRHALCPKPVPAVYGASFRVTLIRERSKVKCQHLKLVYLQPHLEMPQLISWQLAPWAPTKPRLQRSVENPWAFSFTHLIVKNVAVPPRIVSTVCCVLPSLSECTGSQPLAVGAAVVCSWDPGRTWKGVSSSVHQQGEVTGWSSAGTGTWPVSGEGSKVRKWPSGGESTSRRPLSTNAAKSFLPLNPISAFQSQKEARGIPLIASSTLELLGLVIFPKARHCFSSHF